MEMEINDLIEKIKKEGVEEAEKKSQEIIRQAQEKADGILARAKGQGEAIIKEAEGNADKLKRQAEDSLKQSVRDVILMLRQKITALCSVVTEKKVSEEMSPAVMGGIIVKVIENFNKNGQLNVDILLNKEDKEKLEKIVLDTLTREMRKGVTFKVSPSVEAGFRIGEKDKNFYYDFTDEAVAEALGVYLNPRLRKFLDTDKKGA